MGTSRTRSLLLGTILLAGGLALSQGAYATEADADHLVWLAGAALAAAGHDVIDDYGSFATARMTPSEAAALAVTGVHVVALKHRLGRAGMDATDVAPGLTADPASPLYVVQFRGPVKAEWRAALDARAMRVYDYLPDHAYLVRLAPGAADELRALEPVREVAPYHPAWKLSPELPTAGVARVTVLAFLDVPLPLVLAQIAATGAVPVDPTTARLEHVVDVLATPEQARAIARLDAVSWIEPAYDEASTDNAQASAITQSGSVGAWTLHAKGVNGSTQFASVCDTGANTDPSVPTFVSTPANLLRMRHEMHDDTSQPLLVYNAHLAPAEPPLPHQKMALYYSPRENNQTMGDADDADGHGTHTAGTVAGDAPPYGQRGANDGVAFAAKLLVCDITSGFTFHVLNNYDNYWDPAYEMGARVNSNSWGSSHTSAYTEKARQHDAYVWDHRDFLILRSMGNIASTIRPEAVAKSALGIGATKNGASADTIATFSGVGLTQDGRIKPNVVAPGDCVVSSVLPNSNSYACYSGTSMSTPTVAGAAVLVRDYFAKGFYPSGVANSTDAREPSSALVRAILQVSGREIGGDRGTAGFPNRVQGWGRVALDDALHFAGDARGLLVVNDETRALATGEEYEAQVTVAAGQPLRVMLAWSDRAGAAGANPALVNDLDLRVVAPGGAVLGAPDNRNVEEAVYLDAPAAGTYTLRVTGVNVPAGPQPFALVVTGGV